MGDIKKLDELDKNRSTILGEDGRMPVKELVNNLGITNPTLHARMKNLLQSGVLKIAGLVDVFKVKKFSWPSWPSGYLMIQKQMKP